MIHGYFDDICCSTLDWRVHGYTFSEGALHEITGSQLRHGPSSAEHSCYITVFLAILYQTVQKALDLRIGLEIFLNIGSCLFSGNT